MMSVYTSNLNTMSPNHSGNMAGVLVVLLCYLLMGVQSDWTLSKDDDLVLENQLKLLNKPAVKTIKTKYGQLFDCVDFYKQPAFDHPLLKNHNYNFKMKPQFLKTNNNSAPLKANESSSIWLIDGGCPDGTVPIRRITKEDLVREKIAAERLSLGGVHYGVVQTSKEIQYTGVEGYISIYAPPAQGQQYSAARIKIQNGRGGNEFIQTGWRVDQTLYGDTRSHQFVQISTNAAKCFDARCGFVVVAKDSAPGLAWGRVSVSGQVTIETKQSLKRDKDGNWWLAVGESNKQVGFWPQKLFQALSNSGTFADWGGEVFSPPGTRAPPMGSGTSPKGNSKFDAYIRKLTVFDTSGNPADPETATFVDDYKVIDELKTNQLFGHTVFFGGPAK